VGARVRVAAEPAPARVRAMAPAMEPEVAAVGVARWTAAEAAARWTAVERAGAWWW